MNLRRAARDLLVAAVALGLVAAGAVLALAALVAPVVIAIAR